MEKLAITLIEVGNSEAPNVGTIVSSPINNEELTRKAIEAIERHFDGRITSFKIQDFDGKVTTFKIQDNLPLSEMKNSPPIDIFVVIGGEYEAHLEAQETWIY